MTGKPTDQGFHGGSSGGELKAAEEDLAWKISVNKALADVARFLVKPATLDEIISAVLDAAKGLTQSRLGYVGYLEPKTDFLLCPTMTQEIWDECRVPEKDHVFEESHGLRGWVLRNRSALLTNDAPADRRADGIPPGHLPISRFLSVPAMVGEKLLGQIALANPERPYSAKDLEAVKRLAELYALAIERKLHEDEIRAHNENLESLVAVRTEALTRQIDKHEALESVLRKYQHIVSGTPDAISLVGRDYVYQIVNDEYLRRTGKGRNEIVGHHVSEVMGAVTFETLIKDKLDRCLNGEIIHYQSRFTLEGKEPCSYDVTYFPYRDESGNITGVGVRSRDITVPTDAQKALEESELRYRSLFENMQNGVAVYEALDNGQDFRIREMNQAGTRISEVNIQDIQGRPVTQVLPGIKDQAFGLLDVLKRVWKSGTSENHPVSLYRDDVRLIWVENFVYKLPTGEIVAVYRDVTERKEAEDDLRQSEEVYRALVQSSSDHIFMLDRHGNYMTSNNCVGQFCLLSGDILVGKNLKDVYASDIYPDYLAKVQKVFEKGEPLKFEHPMPEPDGQHFHRDTLYPIFRDERIWAVGGICEDITEAKKAEVELKAFQEKLRALNGKLASSEEDERKRIARDLHDGVGQSLTGVSFSLNILKNQMGGDCLKAVSDRLDESIASVEETIRHVREIVSELRPELLDDYGLFAALRWLGDKYAGRFGIRFRLTGEELVPRPTKTVESALYWIAREALTNVVKHAKAQWVSVDLRQDEKQIIIETVDDGIGFDPHKFLLPIEERGWGILGMKERSVSARGEFEIESAPGRGTRVRVKVSR